jgi:hypothetical protein
MAPFVHCQTSTAWNLGPGKLRPRNGLAFARANTSEPRARISVESTSRSAFVCGRDASGSADSPLYPGVPPSGSVGWRGRLVTGVWACGAAHRAQVRERQVVAVRVESEFGALRARQGAGATFEPASSGDMCEITPAARAINCLRRPEADVCGCRPERRTCSSVRHRMASRRVDAAGEASVRDPGPRPVTSLRRRWWRASPSGPAVVTFVTQRLRRAL